MGWRVPSLIKWLWMEVRLARLGTGSSVFWAALLLYSARSLATRVCRYWLKKDVFVMNHTRVWKHMRLSGAFWF